MDETTDIRVIERIYESRHTLVLRAATASGERIVLKILQAPLLEPSPHFAFRNEYNITSAIVSPAVVKCHGLITFHGKSAIIFEDIGGQALDRLLVTSRLELDSFFEIAEQLALALEAVHQQQILHRDLNPSNVVWNSATGQVKLIDFGSAQPMAGDAGLGHEIERRPLGMLTYISPEQTGRIGLPEDGRSDLYSLGATLYHLLTGRPPFSSTSAQEIIHAHLIQPPTRPRDLTAHLPVAVSELVMKLLAKDPDRRYQTIQGVAADLRRCRQAWENGDDTPFPLGLEDQNDILHIPTRLLGREEDLAAMHQWHALAAKGAGQLLVVRGTSGMGKSALVQQFLRRLQWQPGLVMAGVQEERGGLPYAGLIQALREAARAWLSLSEADLRTWRERLLKALGAGAQVLVKMIPEMRHVLGVHPEPADVFADAIRNRLFTMLRALLETAAAKDHPLVLFLDDLQWADPATLEWLEHLLAGPPLRHTLLIVAYRTEGTPPRLAQLFDGPSAGEIARHSLDLAPLSEATVANLLAETLHRRVTAVRSLASVCREKTGGNPFFLGQFIQAVWQRGLIWSTANQWRWNLEKLREATVTSNVAELLTDRIRRLATRTRYVLIMAACLGTDFELSRLALACRRSQADVEAILQEALQAGIIQPVSGAYQLAAGHLRFRNSYRFAHDQLRQAATDLVEIDKRPNWSLHLGRRLLGNREIDDLAEDELFAIVDHLNQGAALMVDRDERFRLSRLNLRASRQAQTGAAWERALALAETALALLPPDRWNWRRDHTLMSHLQAVELYYLLARYEQMEQTARTILEQRLDLLEEVLLQEIRIMAYTALKQHATALEIGRGVLAKLGLTLPAAPPDWQITLDYLGFRWHCLRGRAVTQIAALPAMTNSRDLAIMRILAGMLAPGFHGNSRLLPLLFFRMVEWSVRHGNSEFAPMGYVCYALFLCGIVGDLDAGFDFLSVARQAARGYPGNRYIYRAELIGNLFVRHWREPLDHSLADLLRGYQRGLELGDNEYAAYAILTYLEHSWYFGARLDVVEAEMVHYAPAIRTFRQYNIDYISISRQALLNLARPPADPTLLAGPEFNETEAIPFPDSAEFWIANFTYHYNKLLLCYLFRADEQADWHAQQATRYLEAVISTFDVGLVVFFGLLAKVRRWEHNPGSLRPGDAALFLRNRSRLAAWGRRAPANFLHKHHLLEAELARVMGLEKRARHHYEQAIALAASHGFVLEQALALELAGVCFLAWRQPAIAQFHLSQAIGAYQNCGAQAKAHHLLNRYADLLQQGQPRADDLPLRTPLANPQKLFDLQNLATAYQALTSVTDARRLMATLIDLLLRNAGAQRGCLVLLRGQTLSLEVVGEMGADGVRLVDDSPHPLDADTPLPLSVEVVNYAIRMNETVVLKHAASEEAFSNSRYLVDGGKCSVLCVPLAFRGTVIGAIYLENDLISSCFTEERITVASLLATQAAISLTNAHMIDDLKQTEQELVQSGQMLRELSLHQHLAREREKKMLAQEIHDELGSILTRIRLEVDLLAMPPDDHTPPLLRPEVQDLYRLIEQAIVTTRRIASAMRPQLLDRFGVLDTLKWQAEQFKNHFQVEVVPSARLIRLDELREITLFRIGQEAITNVARHASASRVRIALKADDQFITLTIEDDGRGMTREPHHSVNTMGLRGMRERVTQVGGSLQFGASPLGGLSIQVQLPRDPSDNLGEAA